MTAKKKKTYESFETIAGSNYAALYWDMLDSDAWKQLTASDITLYLYFKRKFHRKVIHGIICDSNKDNITFPKHTYGNKPDEIGYEDVMNERTFSKSIDHLIELGFIRVVENRWTQRLSTIYGFSDMWKKYGTSEFNIKSTDRRCKGIISKEHKKAISDAVKRTNKKKAIKRVTVIK